MIGAVLFCEARPPCSAEVRGGSVSNVRSVAKEQGWKRVLIEDIFGRRRIDVCPLHAPKNDRGAE